MEILQRLQPLDILFVVVWAAIIGSGLQTGLIRQLGMLAAVYGAAIVSGSLYRELGAYLANPFGRDNQPLLEFTAYVVLFSGTFLIVGGIIRRAYPMSRLAPGFGMDNLGGALLAAGWGVLLLIVLLTIVRYYTLVPWKQQQDTQQVVLGEIARSQIAPLLEVVTSPAWQVMTPWFPAQVSPEL